MNIQKIIKCTFLYSLFLLTVPIAVLGNQPRGSKKIANYLRKVMEEANIPGLSVAVVSGNDYAIINFGYADLISKRKVKSKTLFQIGSSSKAYTALAISNLEFQGKLKLDNYVSDYIPWLKVRYKNKFQDITLRQLIHHTSGIPWNTIAKIPQSNENDALEKTVRTIVGIELHHLPGKEFEYATINYDVLALVIEKVTNQPFEQYIQQLLKKLELYQTSIGVPIDSNIMSEGYKIGFFSPRKYQSPIFKGNNAAGYIITNSEDMVKWLKFQLGLSGSEMFHLAQKNHVRDGTVYPYDMSDYAEGWKVSLRGDGAIYHGGLNPNFTAFVGFLPRQKIGVTVLANSNSSYTEIIGNNVLKLLAGADISKDVQPDDNGDRTYSLITFLVFAYILSVISYMIMIVVFIFKGVRRYESLNWNKIKKFIFSLAIALPFLYGIYKLPNAMAEFTWDATFVWTPVSFTVLVVSIIVAMILSYCSYFLGLLYPEKDKFKKIAPKILLMSIASGISNMVILLLLTSVQNSDIGPKYLIFYYALAFATYLVGRRFVQVNLIKSTRELIYDLRIKLIDKIFSTRYQQFEKIDRGRVYTVLTDDVGTVGESINMFVMLITSFFTALGAFLFLSAIAFWATLVTVSLIIVLTTIYFFVSKSTTKYYEQARDTRDVFLRLINGMIDGFKEISMHRDKKLEYKDDLAATAEEYKVKISIAGIRFVNASLIGESALIAILGVVAFAFPIFFPEIRARIILSFIIVLLYLIGPVNAILNSVPAIMRLKIAWRRIQKFLKEIPESNSLNTLSSFLPIASVQSLKVEGVVFQYKDNLEQELFEVGPIDFEIMKGQILFIIGGNGSGKTTLAKLLTGLYEPDQGKIMINDKVIESFRIGEEISTVFSPVHLFEKLYNINVDEKSAEIEKYLKILDLERKVEIKGNAYSTINLSGGQRKRLALLQCYLEDSPIYLFDEWAADQDPGYRNFFYRILLPEMKAMGKIVIAITHDDHYFDVADKILKMHNGKLEKYEQGHFIN